jgi:hypothetical protein
MPGKSVSVEDLRQKWHPALRKQARLLAQVDFGEQQQHRLAAGEASNLYDSYRKIRRKNRRKEPKNRFRGIRFQRRTQQQQREEPQRRRKQFRTQKAVSCYYPSTPSLKKKRQKKNPEKSQKGFMEKKTFI